jgi:PhnB protein
MNNVTVPQGYQQIMPYLIVKNASLFLAFTKAVFEAEEKLKHMRDENTIMHAEVQIGNCVIMFADSTSDYQTQTTGLFIYVDDADRVYQKALEQGAVRVSDLANQPYGRSGGVKDPFGNTWWITSVI